MIKARPRSEFIPPQLATLVESPPEEKGWIHEMKFDGYRLQVHLNDGEVTLYTRNAHDWTHKFPHIAQEMEKLKIKNGILDGEVVVLDKEGRSDFGLLQNALSDENDSQCVFFFFDILSHEGKDVKEKPLLERKKILKSVIPARNRKLHFSDHIKDHGDSFLAQSCKHKLEGIISKKEDAPYHSGRNDFWQKSKCGERQEFVIGGYTTGTGHRTAMGALLLGVYEKGKLCYVGKVGTGFNEENLGELKTKMNKLKTSSSPFDEKVPRQSAIHWIKPKLVAEINFSQWTQDKHLRNPVFVGLRTDKGSEEVVMEKKKKIKTDLEEVTLTHPEKILFAKEKITKQKIADYYEFVAPKMLPYMEDRPLSLLRCPTGSSGQCFYQKHPGLGKVSDNFKSFKVKEKKDSGMYISLNSSEGLKQLVQMNAFEIHVWNSHYQTLMNPDQFVMDFDPDESVPFKTVVKAAQELKKILDKLKLKSFVKVTGGKGIHVHIPVAKKYTWDQIKAFSKVLADEMVDRNPDLYLSTMSKKARKGKIFIDYLRNGYGATAVAPYSLRSRKISSVAMPVTWAELAKLKSADQFTLDKAVSYLKKRKTDPWKGFNKLSQRIKLLEKA